uniref:Glutamate receptor n=1 Tax=Macrostomum lignano TaxID=282301 RepID=A0A1I8GKX2_9PLAT
VSAVCLCAASDAVLKAGTLTLGALLPSGNAQLRSAFYLALKRRQIDPSGAVQWRLAVADAADPMEIQRAIRRELQDVACLIAVSSELDSMSHVAHLAKNLSLPVVMATAVASGDAGGFYMRPSLAPKAALKIALGFGWRQAVYLVNSAHGLARAAQAAATAARSGLELRTVYLPATEVPLPRRYLDVPELDGKHRRRVVVDLEPAEQQVQHLMASLSGAGLNRREFHYLLLDGAAAQLPTVGLLYSGVSVTGLQLLGLGRREVRDLKRRWQLISQHVETQQRQREGHGGSSPPPPPSLQTVALVMDSVTAALTAATAAQLDLNAASSRTTTEARKRMRWHLANTVDFVGYTGRVTFRGGGGGSQRRTSLSVPVLQLNSPDGFRHLDDWRSNSTSRPMQLSPDVAHGGGFFDSGDGDIGVGFRGRRNRTAKSSLRWPRLIRVVTIESRPFVQPKTASLATAADDVVSNDTAPSASPRRLPFEGFCMELLERIAERVGGLKYSVHLVHDGQYGGRNSSAPAATAEADKWNGMIGELLQDTADVAFAALTINTERSKVVDFTEPFLTFGISIMIKKPRKEKPGIFGFLQPLSQVWPYMLTCGAGVIAGLHLCARLSPVEWRISDSEQLQACSLLLLRKRRRDFSLFNSLWFALASIVNQSVDISPRSSGARLVTSVWWFFTLIMIADYTAILAASLTVELLRTPIESWPDLLGAHETSGMLFGTIASGSTQAFFLSTKIWPYSGIGAVMRSNSDKIPVNTNEIPVNYSEIPVNTTEIPIPVNTNEIPVNTSEIPVNTTEIPVNTNEIPVNTTEIPVNTTEILVNTTEIPVNTTEIPVNTTEIPVNTTEIPFHNNRDPCDTMMVGQPFGDNGYGVATQRGSPLRELFNDAILQLREQQVLAELYKKWWIEKVKVGSSSPRP